MNSLFINEDQRIWLALMGSLLIHGILFAFSPRTFIQQAQYSVQPSVQAVEVSIEEIKDSATIQQTGDESIKVSGKINKTKGVVQARSGVKTQANPNYFQNPSPEYPELAREMHQEGLVMLSVDVNRAGDPVDVVIIQSSGFRLLDQAALKSVRHWKFQPGRIGDIPVESQVTVPIKFRLES